LAEEEELEFEDKGVWIEAEGDDEGGGVERIEVEVEGSELEDSFGEEGPEEELDGVTEGEVVEGVIDSEGGVTASSKEGQLSRLGRLSSFGLFFFSGCFQEVFPFLWAE